MKRRITQRAASWLAIPASCALAVTALATAAPAAHADGEVVVTNSTVPVYSAPSTHAHKDGTLRPGTTHRVSCFLEGPSGSSGWYRLETHQNEWFSLKYAAEEGGDVAQCGNGTGVGVVVKTKTWARLGPNKNDRAIKTLTPGTKFKVRCVTTAQSINGNPRWYLMLNKPRGWVPAARVTIKQSVGSCQYGEE